MGEVWVDAASVVLEDEQQSGGQSQEILEQEEDGYQAVEQDEGEKRRVANWAGGAVLDVAAVVDAEAMVHCLESAGSAARA